MIEKQKRTINEFLQEKENFNSSIADLEEEVTLLKYQLKNMTIGIRMLNNGSYMLDEIVEEGNRSLNMKGI